MKFKKRVRQYVCERQVVCSTDSESVHSDILPLGPLITQSKLIAKPCIQRLGSIMASSHSALTILLENFEISFTARDFRVLPKAISVVVICSFESDRPIMVPIMLTTFLRLQTKNFGDLLIDREVPSTTYRQRSIQRDCSYNN